MDRNRELDGFITLLDIYATDQLLILMSQFNKCPTGRYRLAAGLPGIFSLTSKIENKDCSTLPNEKERKRVYHTWESGSDK